MHPYQDQINKMGELIKRIISAEKRECWIEALCLSYMLLEIELRILMSTKARRSRIPLTKEKIAKQRNLIDLAGLAKKEGFINKTLFKKINDFNEIRRKAIHRLVQGEISYEELKGSSLEADKLVGKIQDCWLKITTGPEESYEDYKKKTGKTN